MASSATSIHKSCCICSINNAKLLRCQELTKKYKECVLDASPNHRLSGFTRYPPDTSTWPNWDYVGPRQSSGVGVEISRHMISGGDYRYANHHHYPSTVTDDSGVLSTLNPKTHKDIIKRIYKKVSRDKEKVYVNVPVLTIDEAEQAYILEKSIYESSLNLQNKEIEKVNERKRKAHDTAHRDIEFEANFKLQLSSKLLKEFEVVAEKFKKQYKAQNEQLRKEIEVLQARVVETEDLLVKERSVIQQMLAESDQKIQDFSKVYGGLNRYNLTSTAYHTENPEACRQLFGYESFSIMNVMLQCWFPKLEREVPKKAGDDPRISEYEKCIITIMKFHRNLPSIFLGLLWNRSDTMINDYIGEWAPCLGWAGQQVSLLDLDPGFFNKVYPDIYKKKKVEEVGALVDGKIIQTEEPRNSNIMKRMMYSNKTHSTGVLYIDWILPCGLSFFSTPLF